MIMIDAWGIIGSIMIGVIAGLLTYVIMAEIIEKIEDKKDGGGK
jgi:F0F1-type ATP synthase assembly protein I